MSESLKAVLMRRDKLTGAEADLQIREAQNQVRDGAGPEEVLHDEFGLEPDYVFDLIETMHEVVQPHKDRRVEAAGECACEQQTEEPT